MKSNKKDIKIKELKNKIKNLENKNKDLENKNKNLENKNKNLETKYKNLENKYKDLGNKNKDLKKEKDLQYLNDLVVKDDQDDIVKKYFYKTYTTNIEFDEYTQKDLNKLEEYIINKYDNYDNSAFFDFLCDNKTIYNKLYDILKFDFDLFDYIDKDTYYSNKNIKYFYQEYNEAYIRDEDDTLSDILNYNYDIFDYIEDFYDELHILEKFKKLNDYLDEEYKIYLNEYKENIYSDNEDSNNDDN